MKTEKVVLPCIAFFIFLIFIAFDCYAYDPRQIEALTMSLNTAERLCALPVEGEANSIDVSGGAKVEIDKLSRLFANMGIEGAAKYKSSKWKGPLQKDVAGIVNKQIECKEKVFDKLCKAFGLLREESSEKALISSKPLMDLIATTGGNARTIEGLVGMLGEKDKTIKERDEKIASLTKEYADLNAQINDLKSKTSSKQDKDNLVIAKTQLDNGDLKGASVTLTGMSAQLRLGSLTVSTSGNPFKVCRNQTVTDSGISIFVNSVEGDNSGSPFVRATISLQGKKDGKFFGQKGDCWTYHNYATRVSSVSADCAEFVVSNNEKPCE